MSGATQGRKLGISLDYQPQHIGAALQGGWKGIGGLVKILGGGGADAETYSPHIISAVRSGGAAHGLAEVGDEIVSVNGRSIVSMHPSSVQGLFSRLAATALEGGRGVAGAGGSLIVLGIIRRGDNWGITARKADVTINLGDDGSVAHRKGGDDSLPSHMPGEGHSSVSGQHFAELRQCSEGPPASELHLWGAGKEGTRPPPTSSETSSEAQGRLEQQERHDVGGGGDKAKQSKVYVPHKFRMEMGGGEEGARVRVGHRPDPRDAGREGACPTAPQRRAASLRQGQVDAHRGGSFVQVLGSAQAGGAAGQNGPADAVGAANSGVAAAHERRAPLRHKNPPAHHLEGVHATGTENSQGLSWVQTHAGDCDGGLTAAQVRLHESQQRPLEIYSDGVLVTSVKVGAVREGSALGIVLAAHEDMPAHRADRSEPQGDVRPFHGRPSRASQHSHSPSDLHPPTEEDQQSKASASGKVAQRDAGSSLQGGRAFAASFFSGRDGQVGARTVGAVRDNEAAGGEKGSESGGLGGGTGPIGRARGADVGTRDGAGVVAPATVALDSEGRLSAIIEGEVPLHSISITDKQLIWEQRASLTCHSRALLPLLHATRWENEAEVREVLKLLPHWTALPVEDALELLGPQYTVPSIRDLAIRSLSRVKDSLLASLLMPLTIALRYEPEPDSAPSPLCRFLIGRAVACPYLAMPLFWHLTVERSCGGSYLRVYRGGLALLCQELEQKRVRFCAQSQPITTLFSDHGIEGGQHTGQTTGAGPLMIDVLRRQEHFVASLAGLVAEIRRNTRQHQRQLQVSQLRRALDVGGAYSHLTSFETPVHLPHQGNIAVSGISKEESTVLKSAMMPIKLVCHSAKQPPGEESPTEKPTGRSGLHTPEVRKWINTNSSRDRKVVVEGRGSLPSPDSNSHTVLLKTSNDLRRDQLIIGCIDLMDMLLKQEGIDLRIVTYRVTATSSDTGFVQWVKDSFDLQHVLDTYGDIRNFFHAHSLGVHAVGLRSATDPVSTIATKAGIVGAGLLTAGAEMLEFDDTIRDNFVRSCAGYCVISFLLGIGDRHLENLMLTTKGCLFHIDFEYILGNDPKPFSPPMRLSKQMVMAMGGSSSESFIEFQKYCCKAYLVLRRSARLFLSVLELTKDLNPTSTLAAYRNGQQTTEERFQLRLSSEEAVEYMQDVIHESLSAVFPQLVDTVHKWRQFFKQ